MKDTYPQKESEETPSAAEPSIPYNTLNHPQIPTSDSSRKEKILEETLSVDEYFDELISQVHTDYANL